MNNDLLDQLQQLDQPWFYKLAWGGGALLLLITGWLWWSNVSVQPERVFWGTISNNLVITGVTRHTASKDENGSLEQYQQITLGAQNVTKTVATVEQTQAGLASTKVVTETIATPEANFSRYTQIETSKKVTGDKNFDFTPALNQWSKQAVDAETSGGFSEALFGDLVPLANLPANRRNPIVNEMKKNEVYTVDFTSVSKRHDKGKLIYDYSVTVSPEQYVKALKQIDAAMGLKQLVQLDESQYSGSSGIKVKLSVDAHAHQVISLAYEGDTRSVVFSSYGAAQPVTIPDTTISQTELQTKLNNILGTQ